MASNNSNIGSTLKFQGRVLKEIKEMEKFNGNPVGDDGLDMKFKLFKDRTDVWHIYLSKENFVEHKKLYEDFNKRNIDHILIEILLPFEFPFTPPFIRLIEPRFKYQTGHVTIGGSVCMDLLTNEKWNCCMSIDKIIMIIKQNILSDEKSSLDIYNKTQYGLEEAKSAFARMVANHPEWKK